MVGILSDRTQASAHIGIETVTRAETKSVVPVLTIDERPHVLYRVRDVAIGIHYSKGSINPHEILPHY
jgi:hypothetical protein